jgi:uncharacterized membrane protein
MNDRAGRRMQFIDASRGLAMLFVFLSHFAIGYFEQIGDVRDHRIASLLALPATPTFVILSGLLIGFLSVQSAASFRSLKLKLMDRGLFLLLPAHLLIVPAHRAIFGHARFVFITDTIGVCIILGPAMVTRLSPVARLLLGSALLALSWRLYLTWHPVTAAGRWIHSAFIGDQPFTYGWLTFPVIPWFGAYLMATPLGEALARWRRAGDGYVLRLGIVSICTMVAGVAMHLVGRRCGPGLHLVLSAGQKYPPSPSFLLSCGGLGLAVLTALAWVEQKRLAPRILSALTLLGRTSLVVFVVQYTLYYVGIPSLHLPASRGWPIFFGLSVAFIWGLAYLWDRYLGNEYLTVGLSSVVPAPSPSPVPKS